MPIKKPSLFAASVAAAATSAFSVSSSSSGCNSKVKEAGSDVDQQRSASMDKFAPRYDGLRFIETLVTAHR
ncbi:hypothetical protein OIU79_031155 [Salix purpurea]|uniref:Uncharacterized protein n=2 Tax=Salix TaxID=40685 RepID=A0A9Q0VAU7_SALPP|nr:hypothetical protein SADUNF_Sadunf19G0101800 [Salix dunnii]KAJ6744963.1 hypothetical protein OIU79_031155 [Salix purpurea]